MNAAHLTLYTTVVLLLILIFMHLRFRQQVKRQLKTQQQERVLLLHEKDWLLNEIHHRVKNNLQIVISLLNTQSAYLDNADALHAIRHSQDRMHALSLIHQNLYKADNPCNIDIPAYIEQLVSALQQGLPENSHIYFQLALDPLQLDIVQAAPLGLILNEAISNALKYAYPLSMHGRIEVRLQALPDSYFRLRIADNGKGLPADFDLQHTHSLGVNLMQGLATQMKGSFSLDREQGLAIEIIFKKHTA